MSQAAGDLLALSFWGLPLSPASHGLCPATTFPSSKAQLLLLTLCLPTPGRVFSTAEHP